VLRQNPGQQTLLIRGDGDLFAAYGRTADLEAWLADTAYTSIGLDKQGTLQSSLVEPVTDSDDDASSESDAAPTPAPTDDATSGEPTTEEPGRSPVGSDLWLDSFSEQDQL